MYIPDEFKNTDFEKQVEFVRQHTFAVLVTTGKQSPIATHIPVLSHVKNNKLIFTHIASRILSPKHFITMSMLL